MKTVILAGAMVLGMVASASAQYAGPDAPTRLPVVTNPVKPVALTASENVAIAIHGVDGPIARHGIEPVRLTGAEALAAERR